jgi:putative ABC transport system ATP-binding protein/lipoprotein-releasing system ATP-binding protein
MSKPLVRCEGAARTYGSGPAATVALQPTDCEVFAGDRLCIVGPSGSGKSTLIHLMAGLDDPTAGHVSWPGIGSREGLRPGPVAVVFQGPSLLPPLTVEENTAFPLVLAGSTDAAARIEARDALELVGLADIADKLPEEISGGQSQRAAVARALAGRPRLLLADEPTGQLDHVAGAAVVDALLFAASESGATLVISTHDLAVAERLPTRWTMANGKLERRTEVAA